MCVPRLLTCSPTCARVQNLPSRLPVAAAGATHLKRTTLDGRRPRLTFPVCLPDPTARAHCTLCVLEVFDCRVSMFGVVPCRPQNLCLTSNSRPALKIHFFLSPFLSLCSDGL